MLVLGCRACGEPLLRRSNVVLGDKIDCRSCIQKKDEAAAAAIGAELVGPDPGGDRHYRLFRLACGHVVRRQRLRIRDAAEGDHNAGCETCREQRYADEAAAHGWKHVGPAPRKPGYRMYEHGCGTQQAVLVGNMLWGDAACAGCSTGASGRPSTIYVFRIDLPGLPVIKLGYSRKPHKRLRHQLGIALDVPTEVLRVVDMPSGFIAREEEEAAHRALHVQHPNWVVPKAVFGDAINTVSEIYDPKALPEINRLLDDIAARFSKPEASA